MIVDVYRLSAPTARASRSGGFESLGCMRASYLPYASGGGGTSGRAGTFLVGALRAGGLVPEVRAQKIRQIATMIKEEFAGNLSQAFTKLPWAQARKILVTFPGIGPPGADRIGLQGRASAP